MDWADNSKMHRIYNEMMSVMIMDLQNPVEDSEPIEEDSSQMLKSASEDLNHLIIDIQRSGPSDTGKEQLLAVIDKLKSAGRMMFAKKQISSYTGMPDEDTDDEV